VKVLLAGGSGFLGTAWREHLTREGHEVVRLVRREAQSADESSWDPYAGHVDPAVVEQTDVVATLSGAPLYRWPLTESYKRTFMSSRVATAQTLAEAVASSDRRPALVCQSGVNGYGDRGEARITELTPFDADTFMARVTRAWEQATVAASEAGCRVVVMRSGVALSRRGGALRPLTLLFKVGLGGRVGDGSQFFPTISLTDWVRAATHLSTHPSSRGAYNVVAPDPPTNAEFARRLAGQLHRPAVVPAPAWPIRVLAGDILRELLLTSSRLEPERLVAEGFGFEHPTLEAQLADALG
jgi:uncharacterized protein (TIGR01777 family)